MNPGWKLFPSQKEDSIDENGMLSETPCFICADGTKEAISEAERRISEYRNKGNQVPQGNHYFILSPDRETLIMLHGL